MKSRRSPMDAIDSEDLARNLGIINTSSLNIFNWYLKLVQIRRNISTPDLQFSCRDREPETTCKVSIDTLVEIDRPIGWQI